MKLAIPGKFFTQIKPFQGEYELIMLPDDQDEKRFSPKKSATWEIIDVENSEKVPRLSA